MHSFADREAGLPLSATWLMNAISEYKGKQELYAHQSPQILKTLMEMALIESAESSNRIEGVTVGRDRLKPLVIGHARPRDRSEEEIAGYRKALDWVHTKHENLETSPRTILELHRLSRGGAGDAGQWKKKDNEIVRKNPDGTMEVIFRTTPAAETPKAIEQLCRFYRHGVDQSKYPPLYAIACLVLDFLCIHPFRDGNGRVSRLLTILALYHHGYTVGKYISLERVVEQSKETYYESLNKSSQGWHDEKHDIVPWLNYFLGTVLAAYKELEERAARLRPERGAKTSLIKKAIDSQAGEFTLADIMQACPGVSREMVKLVLRERARENKILCLGRGQSARWKHTRPLNPI